jgi:hypothetical protein
MTVVNKATMDEMMEHLNAILGGGNGRMSMQNKETPAPAANANRGGNEEVKMVKCKKKLCPHCNMFMFHKPNRCYKLEVNKDTQRVGWKLSKDASI